MRRHRIALLMLAAAALQTAFAQVERSGGSASQKIMQQYQQIAAEKTALQTQVTELQTQNAQMKKDLDAAEAELAKVKKERDALRARGGVAPGAVAQATAARQAAEDQVAQSKQRMTELVARFRETAQNLKDVESDRAALRQELSARNNAYDKCVQDNVQLYDISHEVLDRYEHVGFFTRISTADPFTKLTRTRMENLVDEYRQRAKELQAKPRTPP